MYAFTHRNHALIQEVHRIRYVQAYLLGFEVGGPLSVLHLTEADGVDFVHITEEI